MRLLRRCPILAALAVYLLLVTPNIFPQDKLSIPPDEILFTEAEASSFNHGGWRLAVEGLRKKNSRQALIYYDRQQVVTVLPPDNRSLLGPLPGPREPLASFKQTWIKTEHWGKDDLDGYWLDLVAFSCRERQTRVMVPHTYDADGNLKPNARANSSWIRIPPGSITEQLFGIICLDHPDKEQADMDAASELFMRGRRAEKKGELKVADDYYNQALDLSILNKKLVIAITRVRTALKKSATR